MESQAPAGNSRPGSKEPKLTISEKHVGRDLRGGRYSRNHCERIDENLEQELQGEFEKEKRNYTQWLKLQPWMEKEQKRKRINQGTAGAAAKKRSEDEGEARCLIEGMDEPPMKPRKDDTKWNEGMILKSGISSKRPIRRKRARSLSRQSSGK